MVEVCAADFLEVCWGFHAAHVVLEVAFDPMADVGQRFLHPLDVGVCDELRRLTSDFFVEFADVFPQISVARSWWCGGAKTGDELGENPRIPDRPATDHEAGCVSF